MVSLAEILNTAVEIDAVDIGANPIDGNPPYLGLLKSGLPNGLGVQTLLYLSLLYLFIECSRTQIKCLRTQISAAGLCYIHNPDMKIISKVF